MTVRLIAFVQLVLVLLCFVATGYAVAAAVAMPFFNKRPKYQRSRWTSVSLLKPLCGVEPRLALRGSPCIGNVFLLQGPGACVPFLIDGLLEVAARVQDRLSAAGPSRRPSKNTHRRAIGIRREYIPCTVALAEEIERERACR